MAFRFPFVRGSRSAPKEGIAMDEPVRIEPHVRSLMDGDGAVLLDLKAGRYYSLNGVGARIWSKAEKGMTLSQILDDLQKTYQIPVEKLAADLTAFVSAMEEKGLLRARA
jgi:coenzyme PQQ synthesis protein D (PqqD)